MAESTQCRHAVTRRRVARPQPCRDVLGFARAELDAAIRAGEVRARRIGWGQHVELLRADVEALWPQAFVTAAR
jgi:hypothetical protein